MIGAYESVACTPCATVPTDLITHILVSGPRACARLVPSSPHADLYAALVCGVNVPAGAAKRLFVDTGLIHILVVSGAHLGFIERGLRRVPGSARVVILIAYAWITGFGAPIVRALISRLLAWWTRAFGPSVLQVEFATSVAIIAAVPTWGASRSFLMSWLCTLALKTPLPRGRWPVVTDGVRCYVLLYPFSLSAPLTIAWNCAVAPALGRVMFPLCLVAMVAPPAAWLVDGAWTALLYVLRAGPRAAAEGPPIDVAWLWWLPWLINSGLLWGEYRWRRARAFS